jgi:Spy/CpxP family protein refolding chaperone
MLLKDFRHGPPGPPHHRERENFREVSGIIEKELNLSETQVTQFNDLRNTYFKKERMLHELIRSQRDSMNEEMFNQQTNDTLLKLIAIRISKNEYQMELLRIEQAAELKKICTPAQLKKFESLMIEIRDYFKPMPKPHGPQ